MQNLIEKQNIEPAPLGDPRVATALGHLASQEAGFSPNDELEGVDMKLLFSPAVQSELFSNIEEWFEASKELVPIGGVEMPISRKRADGTKRQSFAECIDAFTLPEGIELTPEIVTLFDAILHDSEKDPELGKLDPTFVLERTGDHGTNVADMEYHLDAKTRIFTDDGERVFSPERSRDKYMAYIGRPGTVVIHETVNGDLNHEESNKIANREADDRVISQLLPNNLYRMAIGNIPHSAPAHQDGLMLLVSFNRDQPPLSLK